MEAIDGAAEPQPRDVAMTRNQETKSDAGPGTAEPDRRVWASEGRPAHKSSFLYTGWQRKAWLVARWGLVTAGRPIRRARMLPSFLIVGAERCGTTSMFHILRQHPAMFSGTLPRKEMHYFDHKHDLGLGWYQCHFPLIPGPGSPPVAPGARWPSRRPLTTCSTRWRPNASTVICPACGCWSWCATQWSGPTPPTLTRWASATRRKPSNGPWNSRMTGCRARLSAWSPTRPTTASTTATTPTGRRGHYADQLEKLERLFGRDRIHVVDDGDFFASPGPVYDQILDFLGGPTAATPTSRRRTPVPGRPMPATVRASLEGILPAAR